MKTLLLLPLTLAVALGTPTFPQPAEQSSAQAEEQQIPLVGDSVPVEGHVVVEHPAPQEQQEHLEHTEPQRDAGIQDEQPNMELDSDMEEEREMREQLRLIRQGQVRRNCEGVTAECKCYQFFRGPKNFDDAENFCRWNFPGGHLASITSWYIHGEVKRLILMHTGTYRRAWIGGRRLSGNTFGWLDGSQWSYAQWLYGEPNSPPGIEDCLEVVGRPFGYGTFNDFTCVTAQAFICSYSLQ